MTWPRFAACIAASLMVCSSCSGNVDTVPVPDAATQDAPTPPDGASSSDADADVADGIVADHVEEDSSLESDTAPEDASADADVAISDTQEEESGLDVELDADAEADAEAGVDADASDGGSECGYALCSASEVCKEYTSQHGPICVPAIEVPDGSWPVCPPATFPVGDCNWTECEALDPTCVPLPESCDGGFSCDCIPSDFWSDFCFGTPNPPNCQEAERYVECRVP